MDDKILFVWDFHGVLEKGNEKAVQELCNLVLREFNIDKQITLEETLNWYGLSWFDYFKLATPEGNDKLWLDMVDKVESFHERGWKIIKRHIRAREFSKEVLGAIKNKGHHNIVLTNSRPQHAERFTKVIGLYDYLNEVIGAHTHKKSRLDGEIHDVKAEILINFLKDKNYKKVIAIGDKESDIRAGKKSRAITYLFSDPEINKSIDNTQADYVISDLREVLKELD